MQLGGVEDGRDSTQHAARSTQHAARSTQHAALCALSLLGCGEDRSWQGVSEPGAAIQQAAALSGGTLRGDHRPLSWSERQLLSAPDCSAPAACELQLPLGIPNQLAPVPSRVPPSTAVLFAGCGYLGARFTLRSATDRTGLAREVWYRLDTGQLSGTAARLTDGVVRAWGDAPPADCELAVCDPAEVIQVDPWVPAEHGWFRHRGQCGLADVGVDPATKGAWRTFAATAVDLSAGGEP